MGLDYSLSAIIRRDSAGEVLRHLSALLDRDSQARIAHLDWSPVIEERRDTLIGTTEIDAWGISGLEPDEDEHDNSYCFSLQIQLEPEMETHLGDHGFACFDRPGPFGCMWTSVCAGSDYALVEMTAATTGMSLALKYSDVIRKCWRQFAEKSNAIVAYIDLEDECALQIFPNSGDVILPDHGTLAYDGDHRASVDRVAEFIRRVNSV